MDTERRRVRAQQRLLRDLRVLAEEPLQGVAAEPLEHTIFTWHANLKVDGEQLHFEIFIPDTYPAEAPSVFFPTGLPHPNCFPRRTPDGRDSYFVCLDMLGNTGTSDEVGSGWSSAYDLKSLLAQLQAFVLDDHKQYHRAGGLTRAQALAAARRYCCPHCNHKVGWAFPVPKVAEKRQPRPLLRSLAPSVSPATAQSTALQKCSLVKPELRPVAAEPKPWRDVQRLATYLRCSVKPCTAVDQMDLKGWQQPKKGRLLRTQHAAQLSAEMHRQVAAIRIQKMVRAKLARALAMCLRRLNKCGTMPLSLQAAGEEHARIDQLASSLQSRANEAQAAETANARGTVVERAFRTALQAVTSKRRGVQKKLRQISELSSKSGELSEEQQAKINRRPDLEEELLALERKVGHIPAELAKFEMNAQERSDAQTAAFHDCFRSAVPAEREAARKLKSKLSMTRRFANFAANPVVGKAMQLAGHMDTARSAFIEMCTQARCAIRRQELSGIMCEWRRVASQYRCEKCGLSMPKENAGKHKVACGRQPLLAPRTGVCHWRRVPYTVQVGVLLPMLNYKELILLATVSSSLRASAEDGCLWSLQMSRYHPLSALTPVKMKDWKYAFQCELNQAVASLECFHTKKSVLEDSSVVLGIPIEFTINPKTQRTDYIYSSMDLLSHEAFALDNVRKTVYKEDFTHWLPMYFTEAHWTRSLPHIRRVLPKLLPHRRSGFQPDMALEVFSRMINTLVVLICDKGISFSDRAAKAFCLLHRWALRCMEEWPELKIYVDKRIDDFCKGPQYRCKEQEPNLGELMGLMLISSRPWSRVASHMLEEMMDREVLWLCAEFCQLAHVVGKVAPSDEERVDLSWKAKLVGKRLYAFHVSCFTIFKDARSSDEVARDYDHFYGQPSQGILSRFRLNTQAVLDMSDWDTFFRLVRVKAPSQQKLAEMLRQSVKNSRKRGYHTEGMDFNRVHASGTSKILRKGESFLAAATLSAVDVEEHWSWADGETRYLDATCLVYDSKHTYVGHLDYNTTSLRNVNGQAVKAGALSHSGDQLDNDKQSGFHQIHVQLDCLPSTVQYLYITVSAFSDAKLRDIKQPSVRLLESTRQELCRYDVEGADGSKTAILMCVLHRRPERSTSQVSRWALEAIGDVGDGAAGRYEPIHRMIEAFRARKGW